MATRKKVERTSTLAQQDEADVLAEVEAERDEETGEFRVEEEKIAEVGAVDAASVIENQRMRDTANKHRGGEKGAVFNAPDLFTRFESTLKRWQAHTLDIFVMRLSGDKPTWTIQSMPKSGKELHDALMALHGQHPEAKYFVKFLDNGDHQFRGQGHITLPDTRPPEQRGSTMANPYGNHSPQANGQQPQVVVQPAQQPDAFSQMMQAFELFQRLQGQVPQPQQPVYAPAASAPATGGMDMNTMSQLFEMFRKMQGGNTGPRTQYQQPQPQPQTPSGTVPIEFVELMMRMMNERPRPQGERPPYYPRGEGAPPYYPGSRQQPPPPREKTAAEQFREAMGVVHSARDMVHEMRSAFSEFDDGPAPSRSVAPDDSGPVVYEEVGDLKIGRDRESGEIRGWDTLIANTPDMFKWFGDLRDKFQEEKRKQQRETQRLPPGYVEVGPGYRPPPGYVAVPEAPPPPARDFPPPPSPEDLPPPISEEQPPPQWNIPE